MQIPATKVFLTLVLLLMLIPTGNLVMPFQSSSATSSPNLTTSQTSGHALNGTSARIPISIPSVITQARSIGSINPSTALSLEIVLPPKDPQGLNAFLQQVNDPHSNMYHHFLTQQQYESLYGPNAAEAALISSYLSSSGLRSTLESSGILSIIGSAGSVEKALKVSIQSFELSGTTFYSATSYPQLPSAFANILGIYGLQNYDKQSSSHGALPMYRTLGDAVGRPGQTPGNFLYYTPSEIRQAYNATALINQGYTGTGISIAIVDAFGDPYIQRELNNFSSEFNLQQTQINQICVDGPCNYSEGIAQGWNGEIALDVEWAHAMAPGASINLYIGSNSSQPLYDAVQKAVNDGTNSIISMSWGSPENDIAASAPYAPIFGQNYPWLDQVLQQAAAEGITAFASSGDWGAYDQAFGQTSEYGGAIYPSTDPYVSGVGGSSLYLNTTGGYIQSPYFNATGSYGSETAWSWNNLYSWGTGGGYSTIFPQPSWQKGLGVSNSAARGAPDVSWDADVQTGVVVSLYNASSSSYVYEIIGGTSVGSPSWAGSLALIDQKAGGKLGLINPEMYSILQNTTEYSKAFHDITSGNNNPLSANAGWDPLTGVGSPNLGELANYLAPTGSLSVAVLNTLSGRLNSSYSYASTVGFSAVVKSSTGNVISGSVLANITSSSRALVATNIPLSFDSSTNSWTGSYTIKHTDPPGEWSASILAQSGSLTGKGYTTFSVGDGITMFMPFYNIQTAALYSHFFQLGDKLNISVAVTNPSGGCCVSSGSYSAIFYLGSLGGTLEGSAKLRYNSTSGNWEGNFTIPKTADQGAWTIEISGVDSQGNLANTYSWLNVGLNVLVGTDSPNYLLGNAITIVAAPEYENSTIATTGTFTAGISTGSRTISTVPLYYSALYGLWIGYFQTDASTPSGFYKIAVSGNDGFGNSGKFYTIVRVAPFTLKINTALANTEISVSGGSESYLSTRLTYPNGSALTSGSVEAYVYFDMGAGLLLPISHLRLTYQNSNGAFAVPNILMTQGPLNTPIGRYIINTQAFDAVGNFGNTTTAFYVVGASHSPITITSDSQLASSDAVIRGDGSTANPFVIAGWNTSSISISGGVSSNYEIFNDWVQGSSGDGITIDTPNSVPMIISTTATHNSGNGIYISGALGAYVSSVSVNDNGKNGILVSNAKSPSVSILGSAVANNSRNGIVVQNTSLPTITQNHIANDRAIGLLLYDSQNATASSNTITNCAIGIEVTGSNYGTVDIDLNSVFNSGVGMLADGLGQIVTNPINASVVVVQSNVLLNDSIGVSGVNQSIVDTFLNAFGLNTVAFYSKNSLPLVVSNLIAQNIETGINITGSFSSNESCVVTFTNQTIFSYSSCVAGNLITQIDLGSSTSGDGMVISNLNGTLILGNAVIYNQNDGAVLKNVTGSTISQNIAGGNSNNGLSLFYSSGNALAQNEFVANTNGLLIFGGSGNTVSSSNATLNSFNGMLLQNTTEETVSGNLVANNTIGCTASGSCLVEGGINLEGSSGNLISGNTVQNSTSSSSTVYGIVMDDGSNYNSIFRNKVSTSYAGIGISNSKLNLISSNTLQGNRYGVYYTNAANNIVSNNNFNSNIQNTFPDQPSVKFVSPAENYMASGTLALSWNASGQSITSENLDIDGNALIVNGTSYSWNTSVLQDGSHIITLTVENSGGFTATTSLLVFTNNQLLNNRSITIELVGPDGFALPNTMVNIANSTMSINRTTNSNGFASFTRLHVGSYVASYGFNSTLYSLNVLLSSNNHENPTVVLFVPTILTTILATTAGGETVPLSMKGNITSSELSTVTLDNSNGQFSLSFTANIRNKTTGSATVTIPKSQVPSGLTPSVSIDGSSQSGSFNEDQNNYYVNFLAPQGTHHIIISFQASQLPNVKYVILVVVVLAMLVIAASLARRRKEKPPFLR